MPLCDANVAPFGFPAANTLKPAVKFVKQYFNILSCKQRNER